MWEGFSESDPQNQQAEAVFPAPSGRQGSPVGLSDRSSVPNFTYGPGSQPLAGYTIKRGIGQGGFGEVYYAWSEAGKEVALKLIRRHLEIELRGLRQCLNLKHPNLVSLYDIRQDAQQNYWVIMEYVAGPSLRQWLSYWPKGMPAADILLWMQGICAGVEYLHEHGIVHRDLKPANIFCEEGIVKIGDYGLSKWMSLAERTGQTENVGSVHYMAPEVGSGRYGKEIDIYALGVILYEMLTGHPPFEGQTTAEVLMKHLTAQPDLAKIPEAFRAVVARALDKDPHRRFGTAAEMWQALSTIQVGPEGSQGGLPRGTIQGLSLHQGRTLQMPVGGGSREATAERVAGLVGSRRPSWTIQTLRAVGGALCTLWSPEGRKMLWQLGVLVLGIFVFLQAGPLLVHLAVLGMIGYGVYGLRAKIFALPGAKKLVGLLPGGNLMSIQPAGEGRSAAGKLPPPPASPYEQAASDLRAKPLLQRLTELIGSLLLGAIVILIMGLVTGVLYSFRHRGQMFTWEQMAWLAGMSVLGCWAVLGVSKFWEGAQGEAILRRFVLLVVGLGLGSLGYGLSEWLWLEWKYLENFPRPPQHSLPGQWYGPAGEPLLMAFLANFALLMALIRWWRQADPLRFARLSLWSVLGCVLAAALVAWLLRFPQPWLPMCAGLMSLGIQLAAPWTHPRRRHLR